MPVRKSRRRVLVYCSAFPARRSFVESGAALPRPEDQDDDTAALRIPELAELLGIRV